MVHEPGSSGTHQMSEPAPGYPYPNDASQHSTGCRLGLLQSADKLPSSLEDTSSCSDMQCRLRTRAAGKYPIKKEKNKREKERKKKRERGREINKKKTSQGDVTNARHLSRYNKALLW